MTHRLSVIRTTAALFVALFASAPLVASLHAEDHAHVYCAQHQTIEESARTAATTPADPAKLGWSAPKEALTHRSCELFAVTARAAIVTHEAQSTGQEALAAEPALTASDRAWEVVSVLFEAPKASPPQA